MALKELMLSKVQPEHPVMTLVRYDAHKSMIRGVLDRYADGVDLSTLGWSVSVINSAGDTDSVLVTVTTGERQITLDWDIAGVATAELGYTMFQFYGVYEDQQNEEVHRWRSAAYLMKIGEDLDADQAPETPEEATAWEQLLAQVGIWQQALSALAAEIEDARIDANGVTKESLGDAVRESIAIAG